MTKKGSGQAMPNDFRKLLECFLESSRASRDKASEEAKVLSKITKSANDLLRNLDKLDEIERRDKH